MNNELSQLLDAVELTQTPNDQISGFGKRLREARHKKGLTQALLGVLIGVSESSISLYETNGRMPKNIRSLVALCNVLECTPNYLLGFE